MRGNARVIGKLTACTPEDCAISMITVFELFAGIFRGRHSENELQKVTTFLEPFHLLPFDWDSAKKTAEARFQLEKAGTKIGPYDLQISGQALALNLILVTHNTREFGRVVGLKVDDWELEEP